MSGFWRDDYIARGYNPNRYLSPAEVVEARIDPDQENDNARDDWAEGWR